MRTVPANQLFEIIRKLKAKGVGMVYISHRMAELNRICERVTVIRDGQYIGTRDLSEITMDELVNMIVGRSLEDKYPKYVRSIGDIALEARNVRRGTKVNADYLYVRKGEILGISGLVGAGRTELMRCIFGADRPDSMELWMEGKPIKIHSVIQAIKNGIGYATEDRKRDGLALGLDIKYNTNMAHLAQLSHCGFIDDRAGAENAEKYVVQRQYFMGYDGVKTALGLSNGETVSEKTIDTGVILVDKDNVDSEEVQSIINP